MKFSAVAGMVLISFACGYFGDFILHPHQVLIMDNLILNATYFRKTSNYMKGIDGGIAWVWLLVVAVLAYIIGILFLSKFGDKFRRKTLLVFASLLFVMSGLVGGVGAKLSSIFECLIVSSSLAGLAVGFTRVLVPVYLVLVAPTRWRGAMASLHPIFVSIATLMTQILSLQGILGTESTWSYIFLLGCCAPLVFLILAPFIPESTVPVMEERPSYCSQCGLKAFRKPFLISCILVIAQRICGINAILFFSTKIFFSAGFDAQGTLRLVFFLRFVHIVGSILCGVFVDQFGRKKLILTGLTGLFVGHVSLFFAIIYRATSIGTWIALGGTFFSIFAHAIGPGTIIPCIIVPELFPPSSRIFGTSHVFLVDSIISLTASSLFIPALGYIDVYVFLLYATFNLVWIAFVWFQVPETAQKTFNQITNIFAGTNQGIQLDSIR